MTTAQIIESNCGQIGVINGRQVAIATNRTTPARERVEVACWLTNTQLLDNLKFAETLGIENAADDIAIELIARGVRLPR